jgi:hypothetical protein
MSRPHPPKRIFNIAVLNRSQSLKQFQETGSNFRTEINLNIPVGNALNRLDHQKQDKLKRVQ